MAAADLDVVIRKLAKLQHKALLAAVKTRRAYYGALAAKARTAEAKQHLRQLAKDATEHGTAAVKRLKISADNAADSYARAMRKAAEVAPQPTTKSPKAKKA